MATYDMGESENKHTGLGVLLCLVVLDRGFLCRVVKIDVKLHVTRTPDEILEEFIVVLVSDLASECFENAIGIGEKVAGIFVKALLGVFVEDRLHTALEVEEEGVKLFV